MPKVGPIWPPPDPGRPVTREFSSAVAKKKIIESIWGGVGAASEQKTGEDQMVSLTLYDSYFSKRGVDALCVCVCVCAFVCLVCVCVCARTLCVRARPYFKPKTSILPPEPVCKSQLRAV